MILQMEIMEGKVQKRACVRVVTPCCNLWEVVDPEAATADGLCSFQWLV